MNRCELMVIGNSTRCPARLNAFQNVIFRPGLTMENGLWSAMLGYRRLHMLLRRDGVTINRKNTQRLYRKEALAVRRQRGRRRAVDARAPAPVLALPY